MDNMIILSFAVWNIAVFFVYGLDKYFSKRDMRRIPEKTLLGCAFFMGGIGAYVGMQTFRHKTKHASFNVLVPLFAILNCLVLYYIMK